MSDQSARSPLPGRPRVVPVGVGVAIAAAAVNALIGGFFVMSAVRPTMTDGAGREVALTTAGAVSLTVIALLTLAFSVGLVVLALKVAAGRAWARTAVLGMTVVSALPLVVSLSLPALLVTVLLVVAVALLYRPQVTRWHRRLQGMLPG